MSRTQPLDQAADPRRPFAARLLEAWRTRGVVTHGPRLSENPRYGRMRAGQAAELAGEWSRATYHWLDGAPALPPHLIGLSHAEIADLLPDPALDAVAPAYG